MTLQNQELCTISRRPGGFSVDVYSDDGSKHATFYVSSETDAIHLRGAIRTHASHLGAVFDTKRAVFDDKATQNEKEVAQRMLVETREQRDKTAREFSAYRTATAVELDDLRAKMQDLQRKVSDANADRERMQAALRLNYATLHPFKPVADGGLGLPYVMENLTPEAWATRTAAALKAMEDAL
jgi:hypothetical protein